MPAHKTKTKQTKGSQFYLQAYRNAHWGLSIGVRIIKEITTCAKRFSCIAVMNFVSSRNFSTFLH